MIQWYVTCVLVNNIFFCRVYSWWTQFTEQCIDGIAQHPLCSLRSRNGTLQNTTNLNGLMQVYLQPTNVVLERKFADPTLDQFALRNVVPRLITRSISVIIATTIAAMLPFFGDIMALFGAFGCIPLDFILPMVFYNVTFKPSKRSLIFWGNSSIAAVSTVLSLVGAVASVRQIVLDAKTYRLFANM